MTEPETYLMQVQCNNCNDECAIEVPFGQAIESFLQPEQTTGNKPPTCDYCGCDSMRVIGRPPE